MKESLVQWTLLSNLEYLSKILDFPIANKRGQEISTNYGRIDFIVEDSHRNQIIVELETILDTKEKLEYCFSQILNYKNVRYADSTEYCILYARETNVKSKTRIERFGKSQNLLIRSYSLKEVKLLYASTVKKLSLNFGLVLPKPKNYTICYLRWLNKILKPYYDYNKKSLDTTIVAKYFTSPNTTNFRCYLRLGLDFEMIIENDGLFMLTQNGIDYIDNFNPAIDRAANLSSINLTNDQKKILLRTVTNGNWTPHKVNIYWFLRFIEVSKGSWLPNFKNFDQSKLELLNGLFDVTYKSRTMYEFLNFACNWCRELELVERIETNSAYDQVYLTPLGVEINNVFSLDLQLKKTRLNLNFKYLD